MPVAKIFEQFLKSKTVTTDTRNISQGAIFFALKGENFNGNHFAGQALEAGAVMVVVDEDIHLKDTRIVKVENSLVALQELANQFRKAFSIPVLAITGSNGKTTTKELVRDVLKKRFRVHATKGNFNNHFGVPLTLLSMPADTEFAVIEMGANHQGEIRQLCEIAEPDLGLITNIGKAHLEGFGGLEGVKKGKRELYDFVNVTGGKVIVNTELANLCEVSDGMNRIEYGFHCPQFSLRITSETPTLSFEFIAKKFVPTEVATHLAGAYNLYNIASAIAVGIHFGIDTEKIAEAIAEYTPDNQRSQLKKTAHNLLILDAYNANPSSMENALVNLSRQPGKKFFIIGDMLELGEEETREHQRILELAVQLQLNGITVGEIFFSLRSKFSFSSFSSNAEAKEFLLVSELKYYTILVKGSRALRLEELTDVL
ncbi:MAG: UDP-N-acetylmuramoyl-tripeptide--D-alanyl-D-alanine ligase [Flavobacteriales bacterium]|nr:UDP-N-acetylmuramoyl-tripeptide--D-alanyl-D-alanine ligase [Flavobacteriales bacterium]